jgi:Uma2 family endonuclease
MSSATLIVEILSPSTAAYDRGEKFASYRGLPTLSEYLLIDPDRKLLECFRRNESGPWVLQEPGEDHSMTLQSVDLRLDEGSVFRDADAPPPRHSCVP